jgi:predicted aminopeptidase
MKPNPLLIIGTITLIVVCLTFLTGCYTLKQGFTLFGYLRRAVPLEKLSPDEETQRFVRRIADIRAFSINELGLKDTKNYTRYVEIDRDYLANVVSACKKDSFTAYTWHFPIVGSVPYKGFFNEDGAKTEAEKLKKKDLDVLIRHVDAFSTLGWFKDPLYSFMKSYPVYELADLIIHETLHATVYIKGQSQFDEELAEFIGREGARLYMERRFGKESAEYTKMIDDMNDAKADSAAYIAYIQELIAELETLYASNISREEKLTQKEIIIKASQKRFNENYGAMFKSNNYEFFSRLPVNNAYLELFRLYYAGGSYLKDLFEQSGGDLFNFIAAAKTIKNKKDPKGDLEKAIGEDGCLKNQS